MSETTAPEPHSGLQGEGGVGRPQGREDAEPSWRSNSMSIRTRSRHGKRSCWKARPGCSAPAAPSGEAAVDLKALHAKIGELTLENDFLEGALGKAGLLSAKR